MKLRTKLLILSGSVAAALVVPGVALAGQTADIVPGSQCAHPGATGSKHGDHYICEKHKGDTCFVWHHSAQPGAGPRWTPKPCHCTPKPTYSPSPTFSPSPTVSPTPTQTPTATPAGTPSPTLTGTATAAGHPTTPGTTPAGGGLPDTLAVTPGPDAGRIARYVGVGVAALILGALLVAATRRRRTT